MTDATLILSKIDRGDPTAAEQLLPLVYEELRKLATAKLCVEKPGQTLQATALVHEAYLRLVDSDGSRRWNSRGHFFAAAAEAMRRILVESARRKKADRHGGNRSRVDLSNIDLAITESPDEILALSEALDELAESEPRKSQVVKLRFFAGLTNEQAAETLGISPATAYNDWAYARAWLRLETSAE